MPRKLQHNFLSSNVASVTSILTQAPVRSLTRESLESVRDEFSRDLLRVEDSPEIRASTALFFSGKPVLGSRAIESEFASQALWTFQELVSKLFVIRSNRQLGERGVVADRDRSRLHVTSLVHGSFGFLLEDASDDDAASVPILKDAAEDSARLLATFAEDDEEHFESAMTEIDNRVLPNVKSFFENMMKHSATVRIVSGDSERRFDVSGIVRAVERAKATKVEEIPETLVGFLQGIMPERHEFEMRIDDTTIHGKIRSDIPASDFEGLYRKNVRAEFLRTDVFRGEELVRQKYVMIGFRELNTDTDGISEATE